MTVYGIWVSYFASWAAKPEWPAANFFLKSTWFSLWAENRRNIRHMCCSHELKCVVLYLVQQRTKHMWACHKGFFMYKDPDKFVFFWLSRHLFLMLKSWIYFYIDVSVMFYGSNVFMSKTVYPNHSLKSHLTRSCRGYREDVKSMWRNVKLSFSTYAMCGFRATIVVALVALVIMPI